MPSNKLLIAIIFVVTVFWRVKPREGLFNSQFIQDLTFLTQHWSFYAEINEKELSIKVRRLLHLITVVTTLILHLIFAYKQRRKRGQHLTSFNQTFKENLLKKVTEKLYHASGLKAEIQVLN